MKLYSLKVLFFFAKWNPYIMNDNESKFKWFFCLVLLQLPRESHKIKTERLVFYKN